MGYPDALAVNQHIVIIGHRFTTPGAVYAVKVQQVRQRVGVRAGIVDGDEFELWPAPGRPQRQPANATKPVNAYFDLAHDVLLATFAIRMCDKGSGALHRRAIRHGL